MRKYLSILVILLLLLLLSCGNRSYNELNKILKLMNNYDYNKALIKLEEFETKYPNYNFEQLNSSILKVKCYESKGDYKNAELCYQTAKEKYKSSIMDFNLNISMYEVLVSRLLIKTFNVDTAEKTLKKILELEKLLSSNKEYKHGYYRAVSIFKDYLIDSLMFVIIKYNLEIQDIKKLEISTISKKDLERLKEEDIKLKNEEYFKIIDDFVSELFNSILYAKDKRYCNIALLKLIDYKNIDEVYYSDIIWTKEITKDYFKKFSDAKLLDKKTIYFIKSKKYRKELPKEFETLINETLKSK